MIDGDAFTRGQASGGGCYMIPGKWTRPSNRQESGVGGPLTRRSYTTPGDTTDNTDYAVTRRGAAVLTEPTCPVFRSASLQHVVSLGRLPSWNRFTGIQECQPESAAWPHYLAPHICAAFGLKWIAAVRLFTANHGRFLAVLLPRGEHRSRRGFVPDVQPRGWRRIRQEHQTRRPGQPLSRHKQTSCS